MNNGFKYFYGHTFLALFNNCVPFHFVKSNYFIMQIKIFKNICYHLRLLLSLKLRDESQNSRSYGSKGKEVVRSRVENRVVKSPFPLQ